jgi:hypothetical protein
MPYLVKPIKDSVFGEAIEKLWKAHNLLVDQAELCISTREILEKSKWGVQMKQLNVQLSVDSKSELIEKSSERLTEVINIVATIERLICGLQWFCSSPDYSSLRIKSCHPSTSSRKNESDITLVAASGEIKVLCEVCDIVPSAKASQNKKNTKILKSLGLDDNNSPPSDRIHRFVCASEEYAKALMKSTVPTGFAQFHYQPEDMQPYCCQMLRLLFDSQDD